MAKILKQMKTIKNLILNKSKTVHLSNEAHRFYFKIIKIHSPTSLALALKFTKSSSMKFFT